jgi:glycosyltransferase involved in cell wall biosynthesis
MRIAFFNWRDIRNPHAGGAEVFVHQILRHLSRQGHKVTLFTSSFPGCVEHELIDGVEHVRYGGRFLIYPKSYICYKRHIEGRYDVIVESINGPPFFTVLFAKEKVVPFIHQLTRENWYSGICLPLAFTGYHLEDSMLSLYRDRPALVPSQSTKSDLAALGFRDVSIIHGAADVASTKGRGKAKAKTILYLGRLTRSKRVDHALRAFSIIRESEADARLWIAGSGPEEERLKSLADDLGISGSAEFFGRVSEGRKAELLSEAHLMLLPAVREGWGLVVLEANACGTPVIGYDVHGLRDSIEDGVNGYLVREGDFKAMADRAVGLLRDKEVLERISSASSEYSNRFSWEKSSREFLSFLEGVLE